MSLLLALQPPRRYLTSYPGRRLGLVLPSLFDELDPLEVREEIEKMIEAGEVVTKATLLTE